MISSILIVEDENDLAAIVADYAIAEGYATQVMADGAAALDCIRRTAPDLIVLDLMLPGLDGLEVCKAVREFSDVPIIMLTAKVEEIDRLLGLDSGADDYVCKPFSPRELIARIRAILRRPRLPVREPPRIRVDDAAQQVLVGSHVVRLTASEYRLFAAMAQRPGTIYSRARLLDIASRDRLDVADRAIDTHIKNLRRKFAEVLPEVDVIESVYGLGYRIEIQPGFLTPVRSDVVETCPEARR